MTTFKQPQTHENDAGDAYAIEHDLGNGWSFTMYDDGSAFISSTLEGKRVDLSAAEVERLCALLRDGAWEVAA